MLQRGGGPGIKNRLRECAAVESPGRGSYTLPEGLKRTLASADPVVEFTTKEAAFLKSNEVCRFATASKTGKPQVTPVVYALDGMAFVIAVDYGTKKLKNVKENPNVALVVDRLRPMKAVAVEGVCEVFERGPEYLRLLGLLMKRFESYRKNPWGEGESPIFRVTPTKAASWGFD